MKNINPGDLAQLSCTVRGILAGMGGLVCSTEILSRDV